MSSVAHLGISSGNFSGKKKDRSLQSFPLDIQTSSINSPIPSLILFPQLPSLSYILQPQPHAPASSLASVSKMVSHSPLPQAGRILSLKPLIILGLYLILTTHLPGSPQHQEPRPPAWPCPGAENKGRGQDLFRHLPPREQCQGAQRGEGFGRRAWCIRQEGESNCDERGGGR